eukprot:11262168-Heterocapsa_arctica.AAC.1
MVRGHGEDLFLVGSHGSSEGVPIIREQTLLLVHRTQLLNLDVITQRVDLILELRLSLGRDVGLLLEFSVQPIDFPS